MFSLSLIVVGVAGCAVLIGAAILVAYVVAQERDARRNRGR